MRVMRKDSETAFPNWVFHEKIAHLLDATNIPLLLESIDRLIKKIPQGVGYNYPIKPCFGSLFK
jgi:hypothetical protein